MLYEKALQLKCARYDIFSREQGARFNWILNVCHYQEMVTLDLLFYVKKCTVKTSARFNGILGVVVKRQTGTLDLLVVLKRY